MAGARTRFLRESSFPEVRLFRLNFITLNSSNSIFYNRQSDSRVNFSPFCEQVTSTWTEKCLHFFMFICIFYRRWELHEKALSFQYSNVKRIIIEWDFLFPQHEFSSFYHHLIPLYSKWIFIRFSPLFIAGMAHTTNELASKTNILEVNQVYKYICRLTLI